MFLLSPLIKRVHLCWIKVWFSFVPYISEAQTVILIIRFKSCIMLHFPINWQVTVLFTLQGQFIFVFLILVCIIHIYIMFSRGTGRRTISSPHRVLCHTRWMTSGGWFGNGSVTQSWCWQNCRREIRYKHTRYKSSCADTLAQLPRINPVSFVIWSVCVLQDKCFQYWPTEDSVTYGDFTVEIKGDTLCETFSLRDLVLTYGPVSAHYDLICIVNANIACIAICIFL